MRDEQPLFSRSGVLLTEIAVSCLRCAGGSVASTFRVNKKSGCNAAGFAIR
jgi:hypothetical protein